MSDELNTAAENEIVEAPEPSGAELAPQSLLTEELAGVLEARAAFYETLAALYFRPLTQEQVDGMAATDFSVYADLNEDFAAGVNDITRYLRKRNTGTRAEMAVDFTSTFAGTKQWEGKSAVPYKSVFTSKEGLLCQEGYVEVFRAFKSECVRKREGLDWPDDHLSFMCEFMALLSRRTAKALEEGNAAEAVRELNVSRNFLDANVLSWFDQLAERALLLIKTRFYKGVLKITKGFFVLDRETLDDLIDVVSSEQGGPAAAQQ